MIFLTVCSKCIAQIANTEYSMKLQLFIDPLFLPTFPVRVKGGHLCLCPAVTVGEGEYTLDRSQLQYMTTYRYVFYACVVGKLTGPGHALIY